MLQSKPSSRPVSTGLLVDEFLDDCSGLADATRASYRWALERLVSECPELPQTRRRAQTGIRYAQAQRGTPAAPESQCLFAPSTARLLPLVLRRVRPSERGANVAAERSERPANPLAKTG